MTNRVVDPATLAQSDAMRAEARGEAEVDADDNYTGVLTEWNKPKEISMRIVTVTRAIALGVVVWGLSGIHSGAQGTDAVVGTWDLNVAKSKYSPGPAPKSETRTYVMAGQDIKATSKGVDGTGKPIAAEWTMNYDGKERPQTGNPDADSLSLKRVDAFTVEFTQKKGGKEVITGTRSISKDGKVMTITAKGTNAQGQTINNVAVFERR